MYGTDRPKGHVTANLYIARMSQSQAYSAPERADLWSFWTRKGWSLNPKPADLRPVRDVGTNVSVFKSRSGFFVVTKPGEGMGRYITVRQSETPTGPFNRTVARIPFEGPGMWTYNAQAHPDIPSPAGTIWVSVDVNTPTFEKQRPVRDYLSRWFLIKTGG
jgi:hypothetical protein